MEHETRTQPPVDTEIVETPAAAPLPKASTAMPIAIVISGILIAGAILFSNGVFTRYFEDSENLPQFGASGGEETLIPFDPATDHIVGNPNAPVIIIEYSDVNCPYCQVFHHSMKQLMTEHGADGQVAWVYRHLPIITQDSLAIAYAAECAAEVGGNDAFWKFTDTLFDREQGTPIDPNTLPDLAVSLGMNKEAFITCLSSTTHHARIQGIMDNVIALGVTGTPASFAIVKGVTYPIEGGALPYTQLTKALAKIMEQAKK